MKNQVYTELDESLCWKDPQRHEHNSPFSSENLRVFWVWGTLNPNPDTIPLLQTLSNFFLGHSQRWSSHRKTSSKEHNPQNFHHGKGNWGLGWELNPDFGVGSGRMRGKEGKITFFSPRWLSWWAWPWVLGSEPSGTAEGRRRWCQRAGVAPAARTWPRFWSSACTQKHQKSPKSALISTEFPQFCSPAEVLKTKQRQNGKNQPKNKIFPVCFPPKFGFILILARFVHFKGQLLLDV